MIPLGLCLGNILFDVKFNFKINSFLNYRSERMKTNYGDQIKLPPGEI